MEVTTIQLEKSIVKSLQEIREYPKQTYNELIKSMISVFRDFKQKNQYDAFLHAVQQAKMKEIWDNKEEEAWKDA